jgi:hypothetical protein
MLESGAGRPIDRSPGLEQQIAAGRLVPGTAAPTEWALESYALGRRALVPNGSALGESYFRTYADTVDRPLALAGLRPADAAHAHAWGLGPSGDRAPDDGVGHRCRRSDSVNGLRVSAGGGASSVSVFVTLSGRTFLAWLTTGSRAPGLGLSRPWRLLARNQSWRPIARGVQLQTEVRAS